MHGNYTIIAKKAVKGPLLYANFLHSHFMLCLQLLIPMSLYCIFHLQLGTFTDVHPFSTPILRHHVFYH